MVRLSLPAMVGMFVQATYNMVDALFIGWGVGPTGLAATAVVFPVQFLAMAFATMGGVGASSLVSRSLGAGDLKRARLAIGNLMSMGTVLGTLLSLGCWAAMDWILGALGASREVVPQSRDYMGVILWGFPLIILGVGLNSLLRAQGRAKLAMVTMMVSAGTNVVLDYLFVFPLRMGVRGAALATVISQAVMLLWLLVHYFLRGGTLSASPSEMRPRFHILRQILSVGVSEFTRLAASGVVAALVLNSLQRHGSYQAVAAYGVVNRVVSLAFMPILGVGQGLQPILGYNYGANKLDRALKAIGLSLLGASAISTAACLAMVWFPTEIFGLFTADESLVQLGGRTLRTMGMGFAFVGLQVAGTGVFQAMGKGLISFGLSLSRQVILFIPTLLILSDVMGLKGVWLTFPISDLASATITGLMLFPHLKKMKDLSKEFNAQETK